MIKLLSHDTRATRGIALVVTVISALTNFIDSTRLWISVSNPN